VAPLSDARYASFVVRVLRQGTSGGYIHGQVTHVASRRSKRFTDLQTMVGFILAQLGAPATDASMAQLHAPATDASTADPPK
jgi:hypothetical protein